MRKAAGDVRVESALLARLEKGPAAFEDLAAAARAAEGSPLEGREGVLHAILLRLVREGKARPAGRAQGGGSLYALAALPPAGTASPREDPVPPLSPPAPAPAARAAARLAGAVRDPEAAGRVASDVLAHWASLGDDAPRAFGSTKAARALLARVDAGKGAVCAPLGLADHARRFVVHDGTSIVVTLAVLGLVKVFVAEPRQIPTNSMQPDLAVGDRLIVLKWGAKKMPRRWDIVVFRHPTEDKVLVKRAVGLGGETVAIDHESGDVYADGRLLAKPDDVRLAVREPLAISEPRGPRTPRGDWADEIPPCGLARYTRDLFADEPAYRDENGNLEEKMPPRPLVHDLYLEAGGRVEADCPVGLWIEFVDDKGKPANEVRGVAVVATTGGARAGAFRGAPGDVRSVDGTAFEGSGVAAGASLPLEVSYVDGILRARAGPASGQQEVSLRRGHAVIHVQGGVHGLVAHRDLHYTWRFDARYGGNPADPSRIPEGHVFFLGDHSSNSRDSRFPEVGFVPLENLIGPVIFRVWPPQRFGSVH